MKRSRLPVSLVAAVFVVPVSASAGPATLTVEKGAAINRRVFGLGTGRSGARRFMEGHGAERVVRQLGPGSVRLPAGGEAAGKLATIFRAVGAAVVWFGEDAASGGRNVCVRIPRPGMPFFKTYAPAVQAPALLARAETAVSRAAARREKAGRTEVLHLVADAPGHVVAGEGTAAAAFARDLPDAPLEALYMAGMILAAAAHHGTIGSFHYHRPSFPVRPAAAGWEAGAVGQVFSLLASFGAAAQRVRPVRIEDNPPLGVRIDGAEPGALQAAAFSCKEKTNVVIINRSPREIPILVRQVRGSLGAIGRIYRAGQNVEKKWAPVHPAAERLKGPLAPKIVSPSGPPGTPVPFTLPAVSLAVVTMSTPSSM